MARSKRKSSAKRGAGKKKKSTGFNPFAKGKASSAGTKNTFGSAKGPAKKKKSKKAKSKKKPMVSNCPPMKPGY